ncbi:GNAT family N-acetyltransferase [Dongia sp.]|uniref:GNAT family N-acetyltransferase n=1 Tax=Dongia sp. TaxID=1977262 RepID=UPI003750084B
MLHLRPMRDSEYAAYLDYFIPDYAAEVASTYGLSVEDALARVKQEIAADLPDGIHTSGQRLLCLVEPAGDAEAVIGYLWFKPDAAARSAFINDFEILPSHRGKGLGKQAMALLAAELKRQGFEQIKLRVAEDNARARHVYEATGFRVTGINMSKSLLSE